jgi:hypothetical protein
MADSRYRHARRLLVAVALVGTVAVVAQACSVPVFRYALERWQADPYEVVVFHRGPLPPDQQAQVDRLKREGEAGKTFANVRATTCDLDDNPDPDLLQLWEAQKTDVLPWLVVHYPVASRNPTPVWRGRLEESRVSGLLKSPLRKTIADRLIKGHTAVWVVLESGNKAADDAAAALLTKRMAHLEKTLKLPEISEEDIAQGLVLIDPEDLKLKFSLVRLSRTDPVEAMFVEMLLSSEDDLRSDPPLPMAFPIFGRGRALYALVGKGINNETIDQAGADLTGPCTCTIKEQNPGIDMLMPVAWDDLVQKVPEADKPLPPLVGLAGFDEEPEQQAAEPDEETSPADDQHGSSGETVAEEAIPDTQEITTPTTTTSSSVKPLSSGLLASIGALIFGLGLGWFFIGRGRG